MNKSYGRVRGMMTTAKCGRWGAVGGAVLTLVVLTFVTPRALSAEPTRVETGLDRLVADGFASLAGQRVGLITNHSGIDRRGRHILDLLVAAEGVEVVAVFAPEHGIRGTADEKVADGVDEETGLPVVSLYGDTRAPTAAMLAEVDVLVFDIQDIGARFYTYISTMGLAMAAAAEHDVQFVVLDRPNPLGGTHVDGPVQDEDLVGKFTAFFPMPTLHGMTVGELALLFNTDDTLGSPIGCDLTVVEVAGWERGVYFDQTGLPWVNPSPNMRSVDEEVLYTMVALLEGNKDVSVGRGTDRPFEYVGAPWVDGPALAAELRSRELPGVWPTATTFVPSATDITGRPNVKYPHSGEVCHGLRLVITDRDAFRPVESGVHLLDAMKRLHPERFSLERLRALVGAGWAVEAIEAGEAPAAIAQRWREEERFEKFLRARERVLLY